MDLNTNFFFMSPVEVVRVTPKNLTEVAEWCGGKVARTASKHVKNRVDSYVDVPTPKGAPISWAFPGMYITKRLAITEKDEIKASFSVFRKDYFSKNYFKTSSEASVATWERQLKEETEKIPAVIHNARLESIVLHAKPGIPSELVQRIQLMVDEEVEKFDPKPEPQTLDEVPLLHEDVRPAAAPPVVFKKAFEADQAAAEVPIHEQKIDAHEAAAEAEAER